MSDDLGAALGYSKPAAPAEFDLGSSLGYKKAEAPKEEPEWFMPGSKSEAFVRGFSKLATLGFADEVSAGVRQHTTGESYDSLRDEYRRDDANAVKANPGSFTTGGAVAVLPGLAARSPMLVTTLGGRALQTGKAGAVVGGISGAGNSSADSASGVLSDAAEGAALGGALGAGSQVVAPVSRAVGNFVGKRAAGAVETAADPTVQKGISVATLALGNPMQAAGHYAAAKFLERAGAQRLKEVVLRGIERLTPNAPQSVAVGTSVGRNVTGVVAGNAAGSAVSTVEKARQGQPSQPSPAFDLGSALGYTKTTSAPAQGASANYTGKVAQIESGSNPNARASTSSASGLFQFTDGTWRQVVDKYGAKHGITHEMKNDPAAQKVMMDYLTRDNEVVLQKNAIPVNDATLYTAHFLGAGGANKFFNAPASALAADVLPEAARSNKAVFYRKDGQPKTVAEVFNWIESKVA